MRRDFRVGIVVAAAIVAAGVAVYEFHGRDFAGRPAAPAPEAARPAAAPHGTPPSFDAVHIGPDGSAVIAGRAAPGAEVTVLDRGAAIGRVTADQNGEWVLMPTQPLPPGPQDLSLAARAPGASAPETSTTSLAVLVPERQPGTPAQAPVAVLLPHGEGAARLVGSGPAAQRVALDLVEYDASGRTIFTGRAGPGTRIEIFIDDRPVATATADGRGDWTAQLAAGVPSGRYRLRLAGHAAAGGDAGEVSLDLRHAAPGELAAGDYLAVVPGNTLWHLARRSYGDGLRYVEIYRANRARIDNPDRIYPNQLLALPGKS